MDIFNTNIAQQSVPRWLRIIFKFFGLLIFVISIGLFFYLTIELLFPLPDLSKVVVVAYIGLIAICTIYIVLGWGLWHMQRWVMPLLLIILLNQVLDFFTGKINLFFLISIVLFGLIYGCRKYFEGSYINYVAQGTFLAALIIAATLSPFALKEGEKKMIDDVVDDVIEMMITKEALYNNIDLQKRARELYEKKTVYILNDEEFNKLIDSPEFLEKIRQIMKEDFEFRQEAENFLESQKFQNMLK